MTRRSTPLAAALLIALCGAFFAAPAGAPAGTADAPFEAPFETPDGPALELLSRSLIQGPARTVAFSGELVVIGTGGGLAVFRSAEAIDAPSYLPLDGEPLDIVVKGSVAYAAAARIGLVAIDLSDPAAPRETFRHGTIKTEKLALSGRTLFAADTQGKLHIFDLADPRRPLFMETRKLTDAVLSLDADGGILAVVHPEKATIFRVSTDGSMRLLSETAFRNASKTAGGARTGGAVKKGLLRNGVLLVLTSAGEILCWDIGTPEHPAPLEPLRVKDVSDVAASGGDGMLLTNLQFLLPFDIERAGGGARVKLKSGKGTTLQSLNRYAQPIAAGRPAANGSGAETNTNRPTNLFMAPGRLAVVAPFDGVRIFGIERGKPKLTGFFPTRGFAISLVAANGILYVANAFDGVRIGRVGRDGAVVWIGHLQTVEARDIALSGATLFIADGPGGIKAADVKDPARPRIVGRHDSPFFMSALVVKGERAYCAGGLGGVEIVDVSEPRRPKLVWREEFSEVRGIDVDDRWLYFSDGYDGCRIYSLRAGAPAPAAVLDTPGWNCDCFVKGGVAYLADGNAGISVVDISNRAKPRAVGSLGLGAIARAVHALDKTLFVAAHTKGIAAIDVSIPTKPSPAAWYDTADDARGIFADGDFVYAASGSGGVYIFRYRHSR